MKMNSYKLRLIIACVVLVLAALAIYSFYPIKIMGIQFTPIFERLAIDISAVVLASFILLILMTFLFGRFYCSMICPFGILQEIFSFLRGKRKNQPQKNLGFKYLILGLTFGCLASGCAIIIRYIDPYTIFSSAISLSIFGLIFVGVILILVLFKNRFFCTNICPVGAFLGLIARKSVNKIYMDEKCVSCGICANNCPSGCIAPHPNPLPKEREQFVVDNETCVKCLKCLAVCPKGAIHIGKNEINFNPQRRELLWRGGALAFVGAGYALGLNFIKNVSKKVKDVILPAGAKDANRMANACLNCNLCVNNCPQGILSKADEQFSAIHIDYSKGKHYCKFDCKKCSQVCPSGAIKKMKLEEKQNTRIGMASIGDNCVGCGNCADVCPKGAIEILRQNDLPQNDRRVAIVDGSKCIGCNKCTTVCKPKAITVFAINEQTII